MKIARLYLRVSTEEQDLTRQGEIERGARQASYCVAGVYREKASGALNAAKRVRKKSVY